MVFDQDADQPLEIDAFFIARNASRGWIQAHFRLQMPLGGAG
jgi:hypothetical protein